MQSNKQKPVILKVADIFKDAKYVIPIYQRNYAWEDIQIHQLIDDINSTKEMYFIGNLIVNQKEPTVYEVIDGQQRLTTLYLLLKYLGEGIKEGHLYFEARGKSNRTLEVVGKKEGYDLLEELKSEEINAGYKIIEEYFKNGDMDKEKFKSKLEFVQLIRIQVPPKIDLNHYFEIMNTRGEQLEPHEIAKAKLLETLKNDYDKEVGAIIWESCSNMESYIQMNIQSEVRENIFGKTWNVFNNDITDFDQLSKQILLNNTTTNTMEAKQLIEILENGEKLATGKNDNEEENERFESIISFPNFILQVNKAIQESGDGDYILDDKYFLRNMENNWKDENQAKTFLFSMLKMRFLFDKFILKREFAKDYKDIGKWSLQRLEANKEANKKYKKPKYVGTFGGGDEGDKEENKKNKKIRTIQSCLRITYTSPKTMHWISMLLKNLIKGTTYNILETLENYCSEKVSESNYLEARGFKIERIVFTYLDYILYKKIYIDKENVMGIEASKEEWQFIFRNSIEHFYPQNPPEEEGLGKWSEQDLDGFGNLALITTSGNSKFSNLPPSAKIQTFKNLVKQSLKLQIMGKIVDDANNKWDEVSAKKHEEEMLNILKEDVNKRKSL